METDYSKLNLNVIREALVDVVHCKEDRDVVIHTGAAGADLFGEAMDESRGFCRVYVGKKPMRLVKRLGKLRMSYNGRYYWLRQIKSNKI